MASRDSSGKRIHSLIEKDPEKAAPKFQPKPSTGTVGKSQLPLKSITSYVPYCSTVLLFRGVVCLNKLLLQVSDGQVPLQSSFP